MCVNLYSTTPLIVSLSSFSQSGNREVKVMESAIQLRQSGSKVCAIYPSLIPTGNFLPLLLCFWRYYVSFTCLLSPLRSCELYKGRHLPTLFMVIPESWAVSNMEEVLSNYLLNEDRNDSITLSHYVSPPKFSSNLLLYMNKHITMKMRPTVSPETKVLSWGQCPASELNKGVQAWNSILSGSRTQTSRYTRGSQVQQTDTFVKEIQG